MVPGRQFMALAVSAVCLASMLALSACDEDKVKVKSGDGKVRVETDDVKVDVEKD